MKKDRERWLFSHSNIYFIIIIKMEKGNKLSFEELQKKYEEVKEENERLNDEMERRHRY